MTKTTFLLAILVLVGSIPASANPITDKINAYNAIRKKDLRGNVGDRQTVSDPLPISNPDDARRDAAALLNYTVFKSMETVRDAFPSPTITEYAGHEDEYTQEKATYDAAVEKISYSYLNQNGGHLLDNELKIVNLAHDELEAYKRATPNATQQELADVQAGSIKANSGLLTGLTVAYQNELQAARNAFDSRMSMVTSANRRGDNGS